MLQKAPLSSTINTAFHHMLINLQKVITEADMQNGVEFTAMMCALVGFGHVVSREELAYDSGYTLNTIYRWLRGALPPTLTAREKIRLILLKHLKRYIEKIETPA